MGDYKIVPADEKHGEWYLTPGQSFSTHFTVQCPLPPSHSTLAISSPVWEPVVESTKSTDYLLFNIALDPCEQHDLSQAEPDKVRELVARLRDGYPFRPPEDWHWQAEEQSCLNAHHGFEQPCVGVLPRSE